ncbi:MAG: hypothetical protein K6F50_01575 [Kiritimatiellae bacterium]|nr:hypothetical protein [Kiritimatiellia bacterium]
MTSSGENENAPKPSTAEGNSRESGSGEAISGVLNLLAFVCYGAALVDFVAGNFFRVDFTGVSWSPIALGLVGALFSYIADRLSPKVEDQDESVEDGEDDGEDEDGEDDGEDEDGEDDGEDEDGEDEVEEDERE